MDRRCYEITGWWPGVYEERDGKRVCVHGSKHIGAFVIASNLTKAASILEAKYPGVRIDNVVHKGHRELIVEEG